MGKSIGLDDYKTKTTDHNGHRTRTGTREIINRDSIKEYTGPEFLNKGHRFDLDGHKLMHHLGRVQSWQEGKYIAPIHIDMGLSKFCNCACTYCIGVTQGGMKKNKYIKKDALLRFIRDASVVGVKSVAFIGDGEPTLNPYLYEAVHLAHSLKLEIAMATNGIALDVSQSYILLRGMTYIRFTLGAALPDAYAKIHQVASSKLATVLQNIGFLVNVRKKCGYECTLGLQMVLIPENFDQIIPMAQLGKAIGVDYLQIKQCSDTEFSELGIDRNEYGEKEVQGALQAAEEMSTDNYQVTVKWNKINIHNETSLYRKGIRKYDICYGTPFLGQISGDGEVYPCGPFFGKKAFAMGNIHNKRYMHILSSDRYWDVQKMIQEKVNVHKNCTIGCRQDAINKYLWDIKNPPEHVNFI